MFDLDGNHKVSDANCPIMVQPDSRGAALGPPSPFVPYPTTLCSTQCLPPAPARPLVRALHMPGPHPSRSHITGGQEHGGFEPRVRQQAVAGDGQLQQHGQCRLAVQVRLQADVWQRVRALAANCACVWEVGGVGKRLETAGAAGQLCQRGQGTVTRRPCRVRDFQSR